MCTVTVTAATPASPQLCLECPSALRDLECTNIDPGAEQGSAPGLVMQLASRLGEVASETAADIADDGVIDADEADAILRKLHEMDRVSAQFRQVVTAIRESGVKGVRR